jgi:hypothetical protein
MGLINVLTLAPASSEWLKGTGHPRILHVFEEVCNLINEQKKVLSIVTPNIGNGPFNLVLADDILFLEYIDSDSQVAVSGDQLIVGDLKVSISNAKLWEPAPDWKRLHPQKATMFLQLATSPVKNYRPAIPGSLLASFSSALVRGDVISSVNSAKRLAGLGNGLTPAGDDFMIGAMHAAWLIHPPDIATSLTHQIADTAAPLTTSLSAAWLRSAGRGEAGILWHQLFDALISANESHIQNSINKILDVGETSGLDALSGFMNVLQHPT